MQIKKKLRLMSKFTAFIWLHVNMGKKGRAQRLGQSPTGRYETNKIFINCCLHKLYLGLHCHVFKKNNVKVAQSRYALVAWLTQAFDFVTFFAVK